ncbi:MAG: patatin-like phospholipase family protein, partial [Planctomycetota bacterium]
YLRTAFVFNILAARSSLLKRNPARKAVEALLEDKDIKDSVIPLSCNALNMTDGKIETFMEGNIKDAVNAGTAVGIVFPPYPWNGKHYSDAAPTSSVPVYAARELGADVVLAIDIRTEVPKMEAFHTGFDVVSRIEMINSKILNDKEVASADFTLTPPVLDIFWGDFSDVEKIIQIGRDSAEKIIPELKEKLT